MISPKTLIYFEPQLGDTLDIFIRRQLYIWLDAIANSNELAIKLEQYVFVAWQRFSGKPPRIDAIRPLIANEIAKLQGSR